jgi:hypothetical protein
LSQRAALLLTVGGWGDSEVEQLMRRAHQAAARDLLNATLSTGLVERAIVATDDDEWGAEIADQGVEVSVDVPGEAFHFGRRLAALIERSGAKRVLCAGGASAPLMAIDEWTDVLSRLTEADQLVVTNNVHSCDWVGFVVDADVLSLVADQSTDNSVAWALTDDLGLECWSGAATAATRFDIDTPADLLLAQQHPRIAPHLRRYLDSLALDISRIEAVLAEMARDGGSLALIGRASPAVWDALDRATRCWVRVFAEERGMRASGRMDRCEVRSLIADHASLVGPPAFFDQLARLVNGALIDDRVFLASNGLWPPARDRYNSDLYRWELVEDPYLRQLTRAAAECPVPVVLGGHSVVAGGLMALIEIHQARQEAT